MRAAILASCLLLVAFCLDGIPAYATSVDQSTVSVGGVSAALLKPAHPHGGIILLSGGSGMIGVGPGGTISKGGNQLVRTRLAYASRGFAVLVPDCCVDVAAAVKYMRDFGHVTLVGTSRGTLRAARGIAAGARPDRLVLTSGFLSNASGDSNNVMNLLGSPSALPPTLIVHHRQDGCRVTAPAGVAPFLAWAKDKAHAVWLDGGASEGRLCGARAHHGFNGLDGQVVSVVAGFAAR
ncbi:MAG: alpha/beta hydrolase [Xanthobacteraceae bacterium]|nr:alpha/beta hydrolase [Xanthobacteraceae bacterium]